MQRRSLSDFASSVSRTSEWLVLLYLLLAATPPVLFRHQSLALVPKVSLLDGSWLLDTAYKASGGIWFGRDVAFTYGPLFQLLSWAPSRLTGLSLGAVYASWYTLPLYLAILATFLTARLLLSEAAPWTRALLVLLAVVYWSPPDLRVSLYLLAFAVFFRMTDAAALRGAAVIARGSAAAMLCAVGFLISADTGIYSAAALLLCILVTALVDRGSRQMLKLLFAAAIAFGVLVLVINTLLAHARLDFGSWKSSLAIAADYRWFEPLAMSKPDKHLVYAALSLGAMVFGLASLWRHPRRNWTALPAFLLAGFCFALMAMQSALVRSDHGHVLIGIYPMIFLCAVIVLDRFSSGLVMATAAGIAVAVVTLVTASPFPAFRPGDVVRQAKEAAHPVIDCPAGLQTLSGACVEAAQAQWLNSVSLWVDSHAAPGQSIAVFPYQTAFGMLSRHQVAGGVLQSYLVNGEYLTQLELAGLDKARPGVALYFPDGVTSEMLDGVPNLTRNPDLWLYYMRHYHLAETPAGGAVGLSRDDARQSRVGLSSQPIGEGVAAVHVGSRASSFDLGPLRWPSQGADFLKLRVRVDYPFWWKLRKPSCYTLQISLADGSQKSIQFVARPDHPTDIWAYPWDEETLANYFRPDEGQWRTANRPAITSLRLLITPFDWISVVPDRVSVESVEAVRIDLR